MRVFIIGFCILILSGTCPLEDVRAHQAKKQQFVLEPSDTALLLVASQPHCPLKIENARRFLNIKRVSDVRYEYRLKNQGTKTISDFTLVAWTSLGTGGTLIPQWKFTKKLLAPGQTIGSNSTGRDNEIVPLTEELRGQLGLRGPMKAIIVLMVEKVEFSDGSVYNDEATSKSLLRYLEELGHKAAEKTESAR